MNKVSIVVPAYNAEKYIAETIRSVLSQTSQVHELIIVNDGSTDETSRVARSCGEQVVVHDIENRGVSAARNYGAELVSGEWVMFLDADDLLVPTAIEHLLENTGDHRYGVVYGGIVEFDQCTGRNWERGGRNSEGLPPIPAKANFPRAVIVTPGAAIVRMDLHRRIGGFDKPWQPTEDRDYWMKLGAVTGFRYCDKVVVKKRSHDAQSIQKYDKTLNWGMLVQIEYLTWLDTQGIDASFLKTNETTIAHNAIKKALKKRRWHAVELMITSLREKEISSPLITMMSMIPWGLINHHVRCESN